MVQSFNSIVQRELRIKANGFSHLGPRVVLAPDLNIVNRQSKMRLYLIGVMSQIIFTSGNPFFPPGHFRVDKAL